MDQDVFSASMVIVAVTVFGVKLVCLILKKRSNAAIRIPPEAPIDGRQTTLFAISAPTVSVKRVWFQAVIFVSCRHTSVAPVDKI